jgi:hypothetical protein
MIVMATQADIIKAQIEELRAILTNVQSAIAKSRRDMIESRLAKLKSDIEALKAPEILPFAAVLPAGVIPTFPPVITPEKPVTPAPVTPVPEKPVTPAPVPVTPVISKVEEIVSYGTYKNRDKTGKTNTFSMSDTVYVIIGLKNVIGGFTTLMNLYRNDAIVSSTGYVIPEQSFLTYELVARLLQPNPSGNYHVEWFITDRFIVDIYFTVK